MIHHQMIRHPPLSLTATMGIPLCLIHFMPAQQGLPDLHCSCACVRINKSGAHLSKRLDFTVSGPRRPAEALLQDGDEAGDGLSVGAAPDLPRFCHQGESRRENTTPYLIHVYISSRLVPGAFLSCLSESFSAKNVAL